MAAIGVGIYVIIEDQNFSAITEDNIITGAGAVIAAGIITMLISFIGIFGCIRKVRPLLAIVRH